MESPPGLFPIYCQGDLERCGEDMFLGFHGLNVPVRCPRCGRFSVAVRVKGDIKFKQI